MSKESQPPYKTLVMPARHFDMQHGKHEIPPKLRNSSEIDRLSTLPHGTLIRERQREGLIVMRDVIKHRYENSNDRNFAMRAMAWAAFNSGAYTSAQGTKQVMNRRIELPVIVDEEADWYQTQEGLQSQAVDAMEVSIGYANRLVVSHINGLTSQELIRHAGQSFGNSAMILANVELGNAPRGISAYDAQFAVRARGLDVLEESRQMESEIGAYGSSAAAANPDSAFAVWYRHNAPSSNEAYDRFVQAQEEMRAA